MATVNKDFKIKHGLIVEGASATVNGNQILAETAGDAYILNLVGGATLIKSVSNEFDVTGAGALSLERAVVDAYYDAAGSASDAQAAAEDFATAADTALYTTVTSDIATAKTAAGVIAQGYADAAEADAIAAAALDATAKADAAVVSAVATAAADATSKANAAEASAKSYADGLAGNYDAAGSAQSAEVAAKAYADDIVAEAVSDLEDYTDTAIADLNLSGTYDALGAAAAAEFASKAYTDAEVAALVDGAPALLDTLNELAAAIADNPNYATDVANLVAGKADTTYVDGEISDLDAAAQGYADAAEAAAVATASLDATAKADAAEAAAISAAATDASTKANAAQAAAISAAASDATSKANAAQAAAEATASADATSKANAAQAAAEATASADATSKANAALAAAEGFATDAIDALTTDDIQEGFINEYFTDGRAKLSAAGLLTSAQLTNITITGDGAGLVITAENGVADSDTDDLAEGSTNKYFTAQRAVDALEAVVPNFTAVEINSVAKEVATSGLVVTGGTTATALTWDAATYRTVKALVRFATPSHTQVSEVLLTMDGNDNIAITEYAEIGTNGQMGTITAAFVAGEGRINVVPALNGTIVTVKATLLA